jgi:L-alanine-DL-glutamate epimerase-like enolase superfamily enzyme
MTRIDRIETFLRDQVLLVRVTTDDGLQGWGQTAPYEAALTEQVLHTMVAPLFLGQEPWDVEALVNRTLRTHYKFLGGFLHRAIGGVDTALWDALGKASGQPVYRLLGGAARTSVPMYLSSMIRTTTPEEEAARIAEQIADNGFRAVKTRVGLEMGADVDKWPGRTEAIIPVMRDVLGDDIELSADANGGFSIGRAVRVGRMLEDYGYFHFEEPLPYTDIEGTAHITATLDIPVSGGEQDYSLSQFRRMLAMRAVDIVQPDVGYIGGVSRARKVAIMAEAAGIPCTPHCANHSLLQVFSLHLAVAMPSCSQFQEWSAEKPSWTQGIYAPMLEVVDGEVALPTEPGWGIEIDPEFLRSATVMTSA